MINDVLAEATRMAREAETAATSRCAEGEPVFYLQPDKALVPGHINTELGVKEFKISRLCEFHFDNFTMTCQCPHWYSEHTDQGCTQCSCAKTQAEIYTECG